MPRLLFALAVALASFATICLELMLTRIYSVTMYYHFAFMVISLALVGIAVSGVAIYLLRPFFRPERAGWQAAIFMLLCAVTMVVALGFSMATPIMLKTWYDNIDKLLGIYFVCSLPFLCSGFAIAIAIAAAGSGIGRIYAFDLVGAALGCVFVIPCLSALGAPAAILLVAALAAAAAVVFALSSPTVPIAKTVAAVAAVVTLALCYMAFTEPQAKRFGLARNPEKFLGKREVLYEQWNAFSQVTVTGAGKAPHQWIFIDADAATRMWSGELAKDDWRGMERPPTMRVATLAYSLRPRGTALIIGPGGGSDVISALLHGIQHVVGVEVNGIIVNSLMKGRYADYTGHLYQDPRVRVVVDEGRSYIRRSGERFSTIQATLVDTWAASSSGAFTLTENTLYTVEAFSEFIDHLEDDGIFSVSRWYSRGDPHEFLRLLALGREALERRGVPPAEVAGHFAIATDGGVRGTILVCRAPFSAEDIKALAAEVAKQGLRLIFAPFPTDPPVLEDKFLAGFLHAPSAADFLGRLPYNASPTSDDRPFFFYTLRGADLWPLLAKLRHVELHNLGVLILLILLAVSSAVTVLFVILPLLLTLRGTFHDRRLPKLRIIGTFIGLGLGFILVEIGFMQTFVLFLGHPIYALAVVLATILAASGAGSALSGGGVARWGARGFARRSGIALAATLVIYAFLLGPTLRALLGLPLAPRIGFAVLLVALPGFLMGTLLPASVRAAQALGDAMVPWAWGMNGAASVLGSILAVVISMNVGFRMALLVGVVVYAAAIALFPGPSRD